MMDGPQQYVPVGDKVVRQRVLGWLHHHHTPESPGPASYPAAAGPEPAIASKPVAVAPCLEAPGQPSQPVQGSNAPSATPKQWMVQLWRKWKTKTLNKKKRGGSSAAAAAPDGFEGSAPRPPSRPLSPTVLKQHQQLFELQSSSSGSCLVPPVADHATMTAAATSFWATAALTPPGPAAGANVDELFRSATAIQSPIAGHAMVQPQGQPTQQAMMAPALAEVYTSRLYAPSTAAHTMQLAGNDNSGCVRQLPEAAAAHLVTAEGGAAAAMPGSPKPSASSCTSMLSPQASSSPSPSSHAVAAMRSSNSGFLRTQNSDLSTTELPITGAGNSGKCTTSQQQQLQHPEASSGTAVVQDEILPVVLPSQQQQQQQQKQTQLMFSPVRNPQLQQLLQEPAQQQQLQQLQPAPRQSTASAVTALEAYPSVASALGSKGGQRLLHGRWGNTLLAQAAEPLAGSSRPGTAAATAAETNASSSSKLPRHTSAQAPACSSAQLASPFTTATAAAALAAGVSRPSTPAAERLSDGGSSGQIEDVNDWLLRAALLEDELQGRALEVAEQLQQLEEQREVLTALSQSLQGGPAGAAASSRDSRSSAGTNVLGASGSLYHNSGRRTGIRPQVVQELYRLESTSALLQSRAAGLGSALATLQGCQAVLSSSRAARLSAGSRLAVLQLVLSDVVARLPGEALDQLDLLQGLPALDEAGREICMLAGAGSLHASVQPLLHAAAPVGSGSNQHSAGAAATGQQAVAAATAEAAAAAATAQSASMSAAVLPAYPVGALAAGAAASLALPPSGYGYQPHRQSHAFSGPGSIRSVASSAWSRPTGGASLSSAAAHWRQQQGHPGSTRGATQWYEESGCGPEGDDDDVLDSLSSVLTSRFYTPRQSLSYEIRKQAAATAAAAAASVEGSVDGALEGVRHGLPPAAGTAAPGAASAAGAAALALAGIARSGSWATLDAASTNSKHEEMWETLSVRSPQRSRSANQLKPLQLPGLQQFAGHHQQQLQQQQQQVALQASNLAATLGRFAHLPIPLTAWPESPLASQQQPTPQPLGKQLISNTKSAGPQAESGLVKGGRRLSNASNDSDSDAASCVTAVSNHPEDAGNLASTAVPTAAAAGIQQDSGMSRAAAAAIPAAAPSSGVVPAAAAAAVGPAVSGLDVASLSAALPSGVDLNKMTVGELLQVLSAAAQQQARNT